MSDYNEDHYEQTLIELFTQRLEYNYLNGYDIQNSFEDKDYYCPLYLERLREKLKDLNPSLPKSAIDEAERKLLHIEAGNMVQNNELFMDYLQHGVEVTFHNGHELKNDIVYLADYKNATNNDFLLAFPITPDKVLVSLSIGETANGSSLLFIKYNVMRRDL